MNAEKARRVTENSYKKIRERLDKRIREAALKGERSVYFTDFSFDAVHWDEDKQLCGPIKTLLDSIEEAGFKCSFEENDDPFLSKYAIMVSW